MSGYIITPDSCEPVDPSIWEGIDRDALAEIHRDDRIHSGKTGWERLSEEQKRLLEELGMTALIEQLKDDIPS